MTTALIHEWIEKSGGAERVLDALAVEFPDADIDTLWDTSDDRYRPGRVHQSLLRHLSGNKALAMPFMPLAWAWLSRKRRSYSRLVISSHLFAHHVRGGRHTRVYVYVHTPARYLWSPDEDPRGRSMIARLFGGAFRAYDRYALRNTRSSYVANSHYVANRILLTWGFRPGVIYPPVATERLQAVNDWAEALQPADRDLLNTLPESFVLGASRLVAYKELDKVIEAGRDVGIPVVIAGRGPELSELRKHAELLNVDTTFLLEVSDDLLYALYQRCEAYVFPPVEDFGIMPVEAMAVGARVIVNSSGGAGESVEDGVSGIHWRRSEGEPFIEAYKRSRQLAPEDAKARALAFSESRFRQEVRDWAH